MRQRRTRPPRPGAVRRSARSRRPPLDRPGPAGAQLPSRIFVAVVPDAYAPLAPLFALRGTGPQPWPVAGQFGWSAATATDDQPPRVVLKMNITEPLSISAKV